MPQDDRTRRIPDPQQPSNRPNTARVQSPRPVAGGATRQMPRNGQAQGSQRTAQSQHNARGAQRPNAANQQHRQQAPQQRAQQNGKGNNKPKDTRGAKVAALTVVGLVAIVYVVGVIAFSRIAYPNTSIAGVDVSFSSASSAAARINSAWKHYSLTVAGDNFTWTYKPSSDEPIVDGKAAADEIISQNEPFAWPARLFSALTGKKTETATSTEVDLNANVDLSMLSDAFDKDAFESDLGSAIDAFNEGRTGTFDANGAYDENEGKFTVEKARSNEKLSRDHVIKYAELELAALAENVDLTKIGNDAYEPLNGDLTDDKIQAACDAANNFLGVNVTLKLNGNEAGKVDGSTVLQWISFADPANPTLDTSQIDSWASELASSYNTIGSTRWWTRADGKECAVEGGDYGWSIDSSSLAKQITDAINNKQTGDIDISYSQKADTFTEKGKPDWKAYIDVDLSEQHARYYDENGNIVWEANFISGKPADDATPEGVWSINSNDGASTLIGAKDPETGKPSYESPVAYWMPFEGNLIGFHDATWQADSSFDDSTAYTRVGSHGCINLRLDDAKSLHEKIKVGLCVVVHS